MVTEIVDQHMINLSIFYAHQDLKSFISCFKKYPSIRTASAFIVNAYERTGILEQCRKEGKEFTEWANRQGVGKWTKVLGDLVLIIYSVRGLHEF